MQRFTLLVALTLATMPLIAHSTASDSTTGDDGQSEACVEPLPKKGHSALLQVRARSHKASLHKVSVPVQKATTNKTRVNPSGAAAPLNEEGYSAVADRCCQAEMKVFIERTAYDLGYVPCIHGGLTGMVRYHSCEFGVQSFAKLQADILNDAGNPCTWLGVIGQKCPVRPDDCEDFANIPDAPDCGCSRGNAAKIEFTPGTSAAKVVQNNLGGQGPRTGDAQEIRYDRIGTTKSGIVFDVVITTLGPYVRIQKPGLNGVNPTGAFGSINIAPANSAGYPGAADFKFSFMSPGTNSPVVVDEVHMALFDLDKESNTVAEFTSSKGYKGYVTDVNPSVKATKLPDGRTKFVAVTKGLVNPTLPNALTTAQRQNSVMYFYTGVSSFELSFGTEGGVAGAGRNLFFAFESSLNDRCGP